MSVFMKISTGLMVFTLGLSTQGAIAQQTPPQETPQTPQTPEEQTIDAANTAEVVQGLYVANLSQINVATLINDKSPDEDLTAFADELARGHNFQNRILEVLANVKSISLDAESLSEKVQKLETDAKAQLDALAQTEEAEFRSASLEAVISSHQKILELQSRIEAESTDDVLKALVSLFRQNDEKHLADAQVLLTPEGTTPQPKPQTPEQPQPQQ